jgi:hypothetical protein
VATRVGKSVLTVRRWRRRYAAKGVDGLLKDATRPPAFYSIRSERLLMERLEYDLLFRWFVGIGVDDAAWGHSVFSKNRDRLLEGDIAAKFLAAVLARPKVNKLLSSDHFSVDGTLIEAWASMKSVKPKDGSGEPPAQGGGRNAEAASMARNVRTTPMPRPPIPIDARTTRHGGYATSQRIGKRIEEAFGWIKTVAGQEKTSFRGHDRVAWAFTFTVAAPKLIAEAG